MCAPAIGRRLPRWPVVVARCEAPLQPQLAQDERIMGRLGVGRHRGGGGGPRKAGGRTGRLAGCRDCRGGGEILPTARPLVAIVFKAPRRSSL